VVLRGDAVGERGERLGPRGRPELAVLAVPADTAQAIAEFEAARKQGRKYQL